MNFRYPIFLDLTGKRCLVTGEGHEIARKVRHLTDAGAAVHYVNRSAVPEIQDLVRSGAIHWHGRDFVSSDLEGCFLVITSGPYNESIFRMAETAGILCNAVDDPKHCRYSYGSKHSQGDLTIAISTNGVAPALAVRIKQRLQTDIGPEYRDFLNLMKEFRAEITAGIRDFTQRKDLWYRIVDSEILPLLRRGEYEQARSEAHRLIEEALHPR
jgi:precorrin-2 dehydrogenase/sirohydrochlorin ferrochelatase